MKIRNKLTGQVHEVLAGTLYAKNVFEEVTDEEIKVGEPKVEFEIEETVEPSATETVEKKSNTSTKLTKSKKTTKKGVKKDDEAKSN